MCGPPVSRPWRLPLALQHIPRPRFSSFRTRLDLGHRIALQRELMPLVYIFASSKMEAQPVLALAPENAALAGDGAGPTTQKPDAILVIGLCGGLTETMREEQIVTYTECLSADKSPPLRCSPTLTEAITETLQKHRTACDRVTGITSPRIASNRSEKLALARLGASVVDMETYQILSAAARAGKPSAVLRIVADPLDTNIPDFNSALDAN